MSDIDAALAGYPGYVQIMVRGLPAPQGSKRAYVNRYTGRAALVESSAAVKPWRADVRAAMDYEWCYQPLEGPVSLRLRFAFHRPKGHTGKRGLLPSAPEHKVTKPDLDKLVRSTLDAMTGVVFRDDSQVISLTAWKGWTEGDDQGCLVTITPMTTLEDPR